jgi:hypothetical protein
MKIRTTRLSLLLLATAGVSGPVLADCCSSLFSCAATVVTDGLSCEVQTIIDTIKGLITEVTNFGNDITGITSSQEQSARQYVSNTINTLQSQSQQSSSDLASALSQAQTLYKEETVILPVTSNTVNTQNLQAMSPTASSSASSGQTAGRPPVAMTATRSQAGAPAASTGSSLTQRSTVISTAPVQTAQQLQAPHGAYADAFARAVKQLTAMKSAGDADLSKVTQYVAQAQSSEGPGVAAADTLAGAISSPITGILSHLSSMLTNPLDAFDPSSMVSDMETSVGQAMSADIPKMISDITAGPEQAFNAAGPAFDDLQGNAAGAQQLAAAMANLYKARNQAAANALYALLPQVNFTGVTAKATSVNLAASMGQRLTYATITANNKAARQKLLAVPAIPSFARINSLMAQLKTQRAQGRSPLPRAVMTNYSNTLSSQLNSYYNGKSPAAVASQRDQLVAQARTQYANDPTTANGVIALLTSDAAKRGAATGTSATAAAQIPGQPAPTLTSQSAVTAKPPTRAAVPAPVNPPTAPPTANAPAPTWGPAPAWTPATTAVTTPAAAAVPSTTTATSTFKSTTALKNAQPIQQPVQRPTQPAAPSSLAR